MSPGPVAVLAHGAFHVLEVVGVLVGVAAPFLLLGIVVAVARRQDARSDREAEEHGPPR